MSDVAPINGLVPMIHVLDMQRSVASIACWDSRLATTSRAKRARRCTGAGSTRPAPNWKRGPNLMLTRGACAIDTAAQEVLFYLYASDLHRIRRQLLAAGVRQERSIIPNTCARANSASADPDGYTLMIAQAGESTP